MLYSECWLKIHQQLNDIYVGVVGTFFIALTFTSTELYGRRWTDYGIPPIQRHIL